MHRFLTGRFSNYSAAKFQKDLLSGIIVGVIAIPLAIAFAIASGVKPEYGIYTACIAGILISLFGGSKFQIGGPTGAFVPILFGIVLTYGYTDLLLAGFLAGILLLVMGILKLGSFITFIPRPVTVGFTAGIAVIIFTGQIENFFGLTGLEKHEEFLSNMKEIAVHFHTVNFWSVFTALICLTILLLTPKLFPKVPGSLVGLAAATMIASIFLAGQVETIGSAFGAIPSGLPEFHLLDISWERVERLLVPAFVIAALGGIESLLSAVVADGMTNTKHDSNRELIGQGIANMVTPLFGGIPATGAIARTATNIKSGAVSPVSGIVHGVFVLLTVVVLAPYASMIPLASMAPVLMLVAWNMSERRQFAAILKMRNGDSLVLAATFLLTVFTSITTAVLVGLVLAVFLFAKRMSGLLVVSKVLPDHTKDGRTVQPDIISTTHDCPQISMYTIEGPLFFGAAHLFEERIMDSLHLESRVLILRMGQVPFIDSTGEANLRSIVSHFQKRGGLILVSGIQPDAERTLRTSGQYEQIGSAHFFAHTGEAITYALQHISHPACIGCRHFAFKECSELSSAGRLP
ncbi:sodium-independent anion transporter [Sporosarcina sp. NCCP-2716]|uniref:SulP family inorganic anion transporter n=1 Tax=Sporosarcina sp. NCCP-2716 TaxID=2943679 RepID=UPI00203CD01B|nr:sulfate permease [Sporosarcina sp. NCCP-2716]GKV69517.1 sodium-independent anion transporter [Sporosarcina sp. NCCP-2716]